MMRKFFYEAPELEILEVAIESGFALSGIVDGGDGGDYGDGGEGTEME